MVVLVLPMILLLFGLPLSLIFIGLHVRSISRSELFGDGEPHCRKCDYILRGTSSDICPECGTSKSPDGVSYVPLQVRARLKRIGTWIVVLGLIWFFFFSFSMILV